MGPSLPGPGTPEDWTRTWMRLISTARRRRHRSPVRPSRILPIDPLAAILNTVRDRVVGRSRTFRLWGRDVTLTLDDVSITGSDLARSVGQFGNIHIVTRDIHWDVSRIERLEFRARNVHVRPGMPPTLVAAPVSWELWAAPSVVAGWLADVAPTHGLEFVEGTPLVRLPKAPSWLRLEVRPSAEGRSIRLECIAPPYQVTSPTDSSARPHRALSATARSGRAQFSRDIPRQDHHAWSDPRVATIGVAERSAEDCLPCCVRAMGASRFDQVSGA